MQPTVLSILLVEALGAEIKADGIGNLLNKTTPAIDAMTSGMAKEFIGVEECFILSRGLTSALAFELGLKLQETCYIRARAYHSSDFYHGPMAMVGKEPKVILFASNHSLDPNTDATHRENYVECAKKMEELGADLFVITDDIESFHGMNAHIELISGAIRSRKHPSALHYYAKFRDIINYIYDHAGEALTLQEYADVAGYSPAYFFFFFHKISGKRFCEYLTVVRVEKCCGLL